MPIELDRHHHWSSLFGTIYLVDCGGSNEASQLWPAKNHPIHRSRGDP